MLSMSTEGNGHFCIGFLGLFWVYQIQVLFLQLLLQPVPISIRLDVPVGIFTLANPKGDIQIIVNLINLNIIMNNQSTRNFQKQEIGHPKIKFMRSNSRIKINQLNQIENQDFFLSKILCIHHIKTALRYLCDVNNTNIVKYNKDYEQFVQSNRLRDVLAQRKQKNEQENILLEAFKLEKWAILTIAILSMAVAAASVVIIYYQQTLAKYIITLTQNEQYKWFWVIVGSIVARFLLFNYLMALTNNVAINIKVGLENLFMRAIFFVDSNGQELNMQRMKYLAIQSLIQAINFLPYSLVALCTIIGVVVLVFVMNNNYGFVFFGIFIFFLMVHSIILVFVYRRLKRNEQIKSQIAEQNKWVFRSLLPLIFDRISQKIVGKIIQMKNKTLIHDRFYNFSYALSQCLCDMVPIVSIIVYYGLNHEGNKDMNIKNTYYTAAYLGMLYYPFKIYVYGSFAIIRGFQQYFSMEDNFKQHLNLQKVSDLHLPLPKKIHHHSYPDDLGQCFHYQYPKSEVESNPTNLPSVELLHRNSSNVFTQLQPLAGETIMVYFTTGKKNQVDRYIKEVINGLPIETTVAVIHQNAFVLPESFQQNVIFYSDYNQQRFHQILRLVELDYFIPQIQALGDNPLNYRISKYYAWHECRLELARALYNSVDYLIISKYIIIEDTKLLTAVIDYRRKEGKITYIANNWHFDIFRLADKCIFFEQDKVESGTFSSLLDKQDSILNKIKKQLKREGAQIERSEEVAILHQNFLTLVTKKTEPIELQRKIYLQFFGYAHCGGALAVLLALAAPIGFKIYVAWLIGRSTTPKVVIYPDILIFGVLYLFFVFLRGIVLSFYFRLSSSHLFQNIVSKHRQLCGDQILSIYKEKDDRIEHDFKKVDSSLVICFELGISVIIESYASLVIIGIGQPIVLAMAVPLVVLLAIVNTLYNRIQRKLLSLRERYQEQLKIFVNHCTTRALTLFKYGKFEQIQNRFVQMHRLHIMFSCNQMWILSGMRIIGEIIIIIAVIVFLVIMIETQSNKITNLPMVAYGVSLFLNMSFSYRFNLKTFSIIESQMLSITKCITFFKKIDEQVQSNKTDGLQIADVNSIEFKDVSIEFGANSCSNINLRFAKGDRVAVSTDSKSLVILPFYLLKRQAFSKEHIKGSILINGSQSDNFNIVGLYYIHQRPLLPSKGTIFDLCKTWREGLLSLECTQIIEEFFKEVHIEQLFTIQSQLSTLNIGYQQILSVLRAVKFQQCQVLIMVSAFDYLDILTRIKMQKYLINLKTIGIVINITNNPEISHLYKRHITFKKQKFSEDGRTGEQGTLGEEKKTV